TNFSMLSLVAYNVYRLGEGREIELRQPTLAPMLNKDIKISLCSSALLLPNRCCLLAFVSLVIRRRNKSFNVGLRIWNSDRRYFIVRKRNLFISFTKRSVSNYWHFSTINVKV